MNKVQIYEIKKILELYETKLEEVKNDLVSKIEPDKVELVMGLFRQGYNMQLDYPKENENQRISSLVRAKIQKCIEIVAPETKNWNQEDWEQLKRIQSYNEFIETLDDYVDDENTIIFKVEMYIGDADLEYYCIATKERNNKIEYILLDECDSTHYSIDGSFIDYDYKPSQETKEKVESYLKVGH